MLTYLVLLLLILSSISYYLGRQRSLAVASGSSKNLHSLPSYYGLYTALWCGVPALIVLLIWIAFGPAIITQLVVAGLPPELQNLPEARLNLVINNIKNLVSGNVFYGSPDPAVLAAAEHYRQLQAIGDAAMWVVVLCLAIGGGIYARRTIAPRFKARNKVELTITVILIICSTIAIFTTIGIVLSVLFESIRFFNRVPITEFLFGLKWSPQTALRAD